MTFSRQNPLPLCAGLVLSAGLLLGACVTTSPPADTRPIVPEPANDTCAARDSSHVIGKDAAALSALANRRDPIRVLSPGQPMTMDYQQTRLNVELDAAGKIIRLSCG